MKHSIIAHIILLLSFLSSANTYSQEYAVHFKQTPTDTLVNIALYGNDDSLITSTNSRDTLFRFTLKKIKIPLIYVKLNNEKRMNKIYLSAEQVIKVNILNSNTYSCEDPINQKSDEIYKKSRYYSGKYMGVYRQITSDPAISKSKKDSLYNLYVFYHDSLNIARLAAIKKIPQSYAVLDYLLRECEMKAWGKDTLSAFFNTLDTTYYGKFKEFDTIQETLSSPTLEVGDVVTQLPLCAVNATFDKHKNKPVFIFFWDTECKGCTIELEKIKQWEAQNKKKATILGINLDYNISNYTNYIKQNNIKFKSYHCSDGTLSQISNLFWTTQTPYGIVIKNGLLIAKGIHFDEFLALMDL